ncbi:MAG TPA: PepSY-associated TM helix domain-containing protein [Blastocatellia bacterium]|nr:PepSY-associated TM helix domain-containing protein [Blastocatellia bacterium]
MKRLRKVIFWCHLPVGVIAGLIILIMSVTGVLLTYERQIIAWADTRGYRAAPPPGAQRLPVDTLLAKAREARPDATLSTLTLKADPAAPAAVGLGREGNIYINPYTGEVLGEGSKRVRDFFHVVTDWHRWLGAHGENRAVARAITGACNLGFLFLVVSGLYLWWPRKWTWSQVRNVIWFKRGLPGKARDFNWHNVIGFWSLVPLFIVVLSATVISYTWVSNLVYRIVGETPPAPRGAPGQPPSTASPQPGGAERRGEVAPAESSLVSLDQLWGRAEQQVSGWQSISLRLPASPDELVFTIDLGDGGQPHKRAQLTLDRRSGEVARWEPFSSYTRGRQLRSLLRFAHTGEAAGIIGQTIAGLASAGGAVLVWTGLALAWRRFRAWAAKRSGSSLPAASRLTEGTADGRGGNTGAQPEAQIFSGSSAD